MNYIDAILGIFLVWGLVRGLMKGFFVSLASLVALTAGGYAAMHFSHIAGDYLEAHVDWEGGAVNILAFIITFALVVLLVSLSGRILTKIANFAALGIFNKLMGAAFGLLKFAFIASVILLVVDAVNSKITFIDPETRNESVLYDPVSQLATVVLPNLIKKSTSENDENEK